MFEPVLIEQNKQWQGDDLPISVPRQVLQEISLYSSSRQIIVITGIRRSGKSTVLRQIQQQLIESKVPAKNILFLNVEHPLLDAYRTEVKYLEQAFNEFLSLTLPEGKVFVLLDEIQFFKHWQVFVKSRYELGQVKFFLTGSNSWLLSSEYASLLSGRTIHLELFPFSFKEYLLAKGINTATKLSIATKQSEIIQQLPFFLSWGGFPEIVLSSDDATRRELLSNYYQNILLRDIVPRFKIANSREIQELARYLFSSIGKIASYSKLGKAVGISDKTVKEYLHYFSQAYLLFEVNQYFPSLKRQMANPKKIYAGDNGFAEALSFRFSEDKGRFLENAVFLELKRRKKEVYYSNGKHECDFVVKEGRKIIETIQVCTALSDENKKREIAGLQEAMHRFGVKKGIILTLEQEEKIGNILVLPVWKWLLNFQ
ncbi:ATP-binding protein [Candidatus Woesearchaeota archaeon]|nr:ATP-binding protein [Candidatus Woesearchaeota archaeon]